MNDFKILEWIVKGNIHTDHMGFFLVSEEEANDLDKSAGLVSAQFNGNLLGKLNPGTYLYLYADKYFENDLIDLNKKKVFPQAVVINDQEVIFLYHLRWLV